MFGNLFRRNVQDDRVVCPTLPIFSLDHSSPPFEALLKAHNAYTSSNPEYETFQTRAEVRGG